MQKGAVFYIAPFLFLMLCIVSQSNVLNVYFVPIVPLFRHPTDFSPLQVGHWTILVPQQY
jgi:hypothetical protein